MKTRLVKSIVGASLLYASIANAQPAPPTGGGVGPAPTRYVLTIQKTGNGLGTVTGSGITCGPDCTQNYNAGSSVTIVAAPGTNYSFAGWSGGGCSGQGSCIVSMTQARTVTATFTYTINLAWNDNSTNEDNFEMERRSPCNSGTFGQIGTPAANVQAFSDTNIQAGNAYEYRIRAVNTGGPSSYSNFLCVP